MTICYLTLKPQKLSNRELAKVFETLKRQGQIKDEEDRKLATTIGKSHYVRTYHRYVTIRLPQNKLDAFIERTKIDDSDIQTVRGGISRDLTALEQELEDDEAVPEYKYPSLPLIPLGDAHKSILETIRSMDAKPYNLEENTNRGDNMNVTLSTPYDADEETVDNKNLSQNQGGANRNTIQETISKSNENVSVLLSGESNGLDFHYDANLTIPKWESALTRSEEVIKTRMFIRDIQRLKKLNVYKNEAMLIYSILVKSGKTSLYEELPAEAETSLDEFIKYLKKAYGMNRFDLMKEVQTLTQGPSENPHSFLSRVITLYYEAKGRTKKSLTDIIKEEDEVFEIVHIFLRGLNDQRVRTVLHQRLSEDIQLSDLPQITKNIIDSFKEGQEESL